jgi:predicted permease
VLARNAARSTEIAVRTALGASRARIVSQLFVESLVLALLATGLGLLIGQLAMARFQGLELWQDELAFWLDFGLSRRTAATALGIAVFCAAVSGILPALKATGGNLQRQMQRASAGGGAVHFGRATTALVVAEVALGVICLFGGWVGWQLIPRVEPARTEIAMESFLAARLAVPAGEGLGSSGLPNDNERGDRLVDLQQELERRLAGEPGVRGVAFANRLPGQYHSMARLEVEGEPLADRGDGHQVMRGDIAPGFFEGLGHRVRAGRDFTASDLPDPDGPPGGAVIVNAALVERVFGGGNAIGRRVRYVTYAGREPGPWHEIVGVVGSLGMVSADPMPDDAGLYHLVAPGDLFLLRTAIHLAGDPASFAPRLRQIAAEIDPAAWVADPMPLTELLAIDRSLFGWLLVGVAVVAGTAVVLSVASLHALMAFTVAQRTREIGLRSALGAEPRAIISVIARRAFTQLATGVFIAAVGSAVFVAKVMPGPYGTMDGWPLALAGAAAVVFLVGMLACLGPAVRGLRIRPMEALRV